MKSLIDEANERVSIVKVCRLIGMDVSEGAAGKMRCPFGMFNHSDGGTAKALRIYTESNSAWCFSCRIYYTPVRLYAEAKDLSRKDAALLLLEEIGWKPVSQAQRWADLVSPIKESVDISMLALALRTYCARVCSEWEELQLNPEVAELLSRCLALLDRVSTAEEAEHWLETCKTVMNRKLEAGSNGIR